MGHGKGGVGEAEEFKEEESGVGVGVEEIK